VLGQNSALGFDLVNLFLFPQVILILFREPIDVTTEQIGVNHGAFNVHKCGGGTWPSG
jgi:hypothetical protein